MLIGSLACCFASAQSIRATDPRDNLQIAEQALNLANSGKPLAAITLINSQTFEKELAAQILATLYSFVGEEEKVSWLQSPAQRNNVVIAPVDGRRVPALDVIMEHAQNHQLVIVNEAHDSPRHRHFIMQLAIRLRQLGFEYYACEALGEDAETLQKRGYPIHSTGFYTNEPVFGELLRGVLRLGYLPIAYEDLHGELTDNPLADINRREAAQCANLMSLILSRQPTAKLLIHVGHDHVMEVPRVVGDQKITWLAARLKEATGLDPLTIDQTTLIQFAKNGEPADAESLVLFDAEDRVVIGGRFAGSVDLQVFHPASCLRDHRQDWRFSNPEVAVVPLPDEISIGAGDVLIQALYGDESAEAVPADQFVWRANQSRPPLLLRPGQYRLVVQDSKGLEISNRMLSVTAP